MASSGLVRIMIGKSAKRKQPLKKSIFLGSVDAVLSEFGIEETPKELRTSLAILLCVKRDM